MYIMTEFMWILIWILVGILTYVFIRFGKWSKNVFQYNLRVEGESDTAIHIITILFSIFWPLWWLLMFPIANLIGKHGEKWFEFQRKLRNKGK